MDTDDAIGMRSSCGTFATRSRFAWRAASTVCFPVASFASVSDSRSATELKRETNSRHHRFEAELTRPLKSLAANESTARPRRSSRRTGRRNRKYLMRLEEASANSEAAAKL